MTYLQIETELKENGFILEMGKNPLQGMRFKNETKYAFVFLKIEEGSIKGHQVEYYDINKA